MPKVKIIYPLAPYPLWERLEPANRQACQEAYRRATGGRQDLVPPGPRPHHIKFKPEKEMGAPQSEDHMRAT